MAFRELMPDIRGLGTMGLGLGLFPLTHSHPRVSEQELFVAQRQRVVNGVGIFMQALLEVEARAIPLKNGMLIRRARSEAEQAALVDEPVACLREDRGKHYFRMREAFEEQMPYWLALEYCPMPIMPCTEDHEPFVVAGFQDGYQLPTHEPIADRHARVMSDGTVTTGLSWRAESSTTPVERAYQLDGTPEVIAEIQAKTV